MRPHKLPKIWNGATAYVIGGGASIVRTFNIPDHVVEGVRTRRLPVSAYAPYMTQLHSKHVLGVNVAYQLGSWVDFCFFGDEGFGMKHLHGFCNYKGKVLTIRDKFAQPCYKHYRITYIAKSNRTNGIDAKKVCWNGNSGMAAVNVAYLLGATRIVLVGFDMNVDKDYQHYHQQYRKEKRAKNLPFKQHLSCMDAVKADADKLGVEIINSNPDSAITQFEKQPFSELI